jgi:uncharacterized RDD family membrane protein YckC/cytoskeletal protein CcmA (bactofilin family)
MNKTFRQLFGSVLIALSFTFALVARAQEAPMPPPPPPAPVAPAGEPEASPAELRRLDETEAVDPATEESEDLASEETLSGPADKEVEVLNDEEEREHAYRYDRSDEFPLGNHTVALGRRVREVVSIKGSTVVEGEVAGEAVSILGDTRINGSIGSEAVAVLGDVYVQGTVGGEVVAILGNVELGPKAVVEGNVIVIGGELTRDPGAVVNGNVREITFVGGGQSLQRLKTWFNECLLWGRPLAFHRDLFWAWVIAGGVFAFYVLLALLFPRAFEKCAETLEQRPGSSLLAVLLTVLITPVLIVLLVVTGVGVLLIPFVAAGLFFAGIFGKAVMHAWLGRRITRYFGPGPLGHVATATVIGGALVLVLYTVPFLGFILWKVLDIVGLGVVVYTIILSTRREKPASVRPAGATGVVASPPAAVGLVPDGAGIAAPMESAATLPPVITAATLPRAGFWIRLAASAIDAVLIAIVVGITGAGDAFLAFFALYCVVLWGFKGTTVGGIVCGLRVVRVDDRKVDWIVAVVRCLGGFLSLAVAGLGFIWVAFDDQKQSWHDKIAGTTVVHVPKGISLI